MTATLGKIEEFDGGREEWPQYVERMGHFFTANAITDADKKRAVFLSVVGPATYKLLRSLVSPKKPGEKSYDELVQVLTAHYNPTPSETVQRFKFHSRFRKQGESVATFVAELRSLAEFCNFKNTLEDMLRDRIVCGINNGAIQKRLLAESTLTYQKALELAQGLEAAAKNLRELQAPGTKKDEDSPIASNTQEVHKVVPSGKGRSNSIIAVVGQVMMLPSAALKKLCATSVASEDT